jgi:hypothetical protein
MEEDPEAVCGVQANLQRKDGADDELVGEADPGAVADRKRLKFSLRKPADVTWS